MAWPSITGVSSITRPVIAQDGKLNPTNTIQALLPPRRDASLRYTLLVNIRMHEAHYVNNNIVVSQLVCMFLISRMCSRELGSIRPPPILSRQLTRITK